MWVSERDAAAQAIPPAVGAGGSRALPPSPAAQGSEHVQAVGTFCDDGARQPGIASGGAPQRRCPAIVYSLIRPCCLACANTSHSMTVRPHLHIAVAATR